MRGLPSPCMDVCRYELDGHCIHCAMTKPQKGMFGALRKPAAQAAFVQALAAQQDEVAASHPDACFARWRAAYGHKCRAMGKESPLAADATQD